MLEFLDGTDLHNMIRLLLNGGTERIIVVEGEDDYDLLIEAFSENDVTIVPGYGKAKTLAAAIEAQADGTHPVRFLLDADFDRLTGDAALYPANVAATEHYDLAMDVLEHLPVVQRIVRLATGKAGTALLDAGEQIQLAYRIAEQFGSVRYASWVETWNLNFDGFPFHMFMPASASDPVDVSAVVALLVSRTGKCTHDPEVICSAVPAHQGAVEKARLLVNSHDLFDILLKVGTKFGGAKSNTGYETQFVLAAAGQIREVPVVAGLVDWVRAA